LKYKEVHMHLEGSVFDEALQRIKNRRNIKTFKASSSSKRDIFFQKMNYISKEILISKQNYLDVFKEICNSLSKTHDYLELTVSPGAYDFYHKGGFKEIVLELAENANKCGFDIRFLVEILKNSGIEKCFDYLDFASECINSLSNVVGVSFSGDDAKYPLKNFIPHIKKAKKMGLNVSVHAGEWGNAGDVLMALEAGVDRIGHGIRSVDDNRVLEKLKDSGIFLEVCPTSNLATGASLDLMELKKLAEHEVNMIVNTDDPAVFNVSLRHEIDLFRKMCPDYKFKEPRLFKKF
jgi:adenosine deaminase